MFKYKSKAQIALMDEAEKARYMADKAAYEKDFSRFRVKTPAQLEKMSDEELDEYMARKSEFDETERLKTVVAVQDENSEAIQSAIKATVDSSIKVVQDHVDKLDLAIQNGKKATDKSETLGESLVKGISDNFKDTIDKAVNSSGKLAVGVGERVAFTVKAPALMTTTASLTGEGQITYRQGGAYVLPASLTNFRDLVPIVSSPTGIYAGYKETGGEGAVGFQETEGAKKPFLDVDFTQIKIVDKTIAGTVDFSTRLMKHLPWLQSTLSRILTRKFYEAENAYGYATVSAAATGGAVPPAGSVPVANLIGYLMAFAQSKFRPAYVIISFTDFGSILNLDKTNSPFGLAYNPATGAFTIAGIPIIPVDWATPGKALIYDRDYVELVVTDDVTVSFSYENKDNFEKNVVTARIEAMEEVNVVFPQAVVYQDLAGAPEGE